MKKELFKIELSDEAEIDFDKSYEYYSTISLKVADNFYKQINSSFRKIAGSPFSCQQVYLEIRQFVLKKYPFIIYFRIQETVIQIIAIFHTSRSPFIWQERVKL
jgi:plasmid stabilization system protein ParE